MGPGQGDDGGIVGVFSLVEGSPLKRRGFAAELGDFADKASYQEWVFWREARADGTAFIIYVNDIYNF